MFFQVWVKQSLHVLHDGNVKNLNSIQHLIVSNFLKLTQVQSRVLYKESSKLTTFTPTCMCTCMYYEGVKVQNKGDTDQSLCI